MILLHGKDGGRGVAEGLTQAFPPLQPPLLQQLGLPLITYMLHDVGPDVRPLTQTQPEETQQKVSQGITQEEDPPPSPQLGGTVLGKEAGAPGGEWVSLKGWASH